MKTPEAITIVELKRLYKILELKQSYKKLEQETLKRIEDEETFEEASMPYIRFAIKIDWASQIKGWNEEEIPVASLFTIILETFRFTEQEVMSFKNTFIEVLFEFYRERLKKKWW